MSWLSMFGNKRPCCAILYSGKNGKQAAHCNYVDRLGSVLAPSKAAKIKNIGARREILILGILSAIAPLIKAQMPVSIGYKIENVKTRSDCIEATKAK